MSTHDVIPVSGGEEPSSAAYVKITTTPSGPSFEASVPGAEAGRMLKTSHLAFGICGTVIAPPVMAKALDVVGLGMPWPMTALLLALASMLPLACYTMATRART